MIFSKVALLVLTLLFYGVCGQDTRGFKQFIDSKVSPCEDFYQYACGKWSPNNVEAVDVITDQKLENRYTIKQYFTSLRRRGLTDNTASEFYRICVDSKFQLDEDIIQDYLSALVEISEWPYLNETFKETSFDWLTVAAHLRRHQVDTLFQLSIQRNWKDSRQHLIYLTSSKKLFNGPANGDAAFVYKTYVKYILLGFGVRVRKANVIAQQVVDFEVELEKLNSDLKDELIDPISLDKLIEELPGINWRLFFETLLGKQASLPQLVIIKLDFFKKLETLLAETKPETIALFQLTRFLRHYQVNMDHPDWISCMDEVNSKMPLIVSRDFVSLRKTFPAAKATEIFENIREEFLQQINDTNWYDTKTKDEIKTKLETMRILIGYPDMELEIQPEIRIDSESYQKSRMLLDKLNAKNEFNLLTRPSVVANRNLKPLMVNAYYKLTTNTLEIPIGILQPPMYREDSNLAQVMGSLGTIIAHELVHGFDYDGQNYDQAGNIKQEPNPKSIIQFGLRANCFIDQYSGATINALNEDIADNEGLRLAYGAYERYRAKHPFIDSSITGDQLFFISFAQIWCRSEASTGTILRNHSSHKDRVNNAVANSERFSEAFTCRIGSRLNPVKKCQIW